MTNPKLSLIKLLSSVNLKTLPVTFSERIRTKHELIIQSRLNLMLDDKVVLCITHRELDYATSFSMEVVDITGKRMVLADTELPIDMVRAVDGLIAGLSIVNEQ